MSPQSNGEPWGNRVIKRSEENVIAGDPKEGRRHWETPRVITATISTVVAVTKHTIVGESVGSTFVIAS